MIKIKELLGTNGFLNVPSYSYINKNIHSNQSNLPTSGLEM